MGQKYTVEQAIRNNDDSKGEKKYIYRKTVSLRYIKGQRERIYIPTRTIISYTKRFS